MPWYGSGKKQFWPVERNGAIPVNVQDQTTEIIDLLFSRQIADLDILANTALDDTSITVSCATTPVVGDSVCLKEEYAFYQGDILAVVNNGGGSYTLTLDSPLDYAYTTAGGCSLRNKNMNVNGSVTPVTFFISPNGLTDSVFPSNPQKWHITRLMIFIGDDSAMDDSRFGSIANGIARGVVIRKKDGRYKNIFTARTNGDFALRAYDVQYVESTLPPAGAFGMRVRRTFSGQEKNGAAILLDAATNDELQIIIRDDLTSQSKFVAVAQGHIVTD